MKKLTMAMIVLALAACAAPAGAHWDRFVEVARKAEPSVVTVKALRDANRQALGSGVIYRADGYIVTTADVVRGAEAVEVVQVLPGGDAGRREETREGKVVGSDEISGVAVVKVDAADLPAAAFGDSDQAQKGAWIMVMGNSLGMASSLALGVISNRDVLEGDMLQLSAPVNPGNSGAPVFNEKGEVIGIVVTSARHGARIMMPNLPQIYGTPQLQGYTGQLPGKEGIFLFTPQGENDPQVWLKMVEPYLKGVQEELARQGLDYQVLIKQLQAEMEKNPEVRQEVIEALREADADVKEAIQETEGDLKEAQEELKAAEEELQRAREAGEGGEELEQAETELTAARAELEQAMQLQKRIAIGYQPNPDRAEEYRVQVEPYQGGYRVLGGKEGDPLAVIAGLPDLGAAQGLNFALPANMVKWVADQLIEHGRVRRGYLGVQIQDLPEELRTQLNLPEGQGVLVGKVMPDTPAAQGGLQEWDVVVSFGGQPVGSPKALQRRVGAAEPGGTVELEVLRKGERLNLNVTLGEAPAAPDPKMQVTVMAPPPPQLAGRPWLGLIVESELPPALKNHFGLEYGLIIERVYDESPASKAGLRKGDILLELDGQQLKTVEQLREMLQASKVGQELEMVALREGKRQTVTVTLEAAGDLSRYMDRARPGGIFARQGQEL